MPPPPPFAPAKRDAEDVPAADPEAPAPPMKKRLVEEGTYGEEAVTVPMPQAPPEEGGGTAPPVEENGGAAPLEENGGTEPSPPAVGAEAPAVAVAVPMPQAPPEAEESAPPEAAAVENGGTAPASPPAAEKKAPEPEGMMETPEAKSEVAVTPSAPDRSDPIGEGFSPEESNEVRVQVVRAPPDEEAEAAATATEPAATEPAVAAEKEEAEEAASKGEGALPAPFELPTAKLVGLRGKLSKREDGTHAIAGLWALSLDTLDKDPENEKGEALEFEYEHTPEGDAGVFPSSGTYAGWFHLVSDDGKDKVRSEEKNVRLNFTKNSGGYHNLEGRGSNIYGSYAVRGTLRDGVVTMCRDFGPEPKPKRTKKVASGGRTKFTVRKRRSRSPGRDSGGGQGGVPKRRGRPPSSPSPSKAKRGGRRRSLSLGPIPEECAPAKRYKDRGRRYGLGAPGLRCDVCFFEEDEDRISDTPFVKCLHCGLVAHSACYPPLGNVDDKGGFVCDACAAFYVPQANRAARTKHKGEGEVVTESYEVPEDAGARGDGRTTRGDGASCQLCARNDVKGGMKPTDSGTWVHLACLMATNDAFFENSVAVDVGKALKKNKLQIKKAQKGAAVGCDGCGGTGGMLLKCVHPGCSIYVHALCAEILNCNRVIENDGTRDVISYRCALHAFEGKDACGVCGLADRPEETLECDGCGQGYHMGCLDPPLEEVPEGDWFCPKCVKAEEPAREGGEWTPSQGKPERPQSAYNFFYRDEKAKILDEADGPEVHDPEELDDRIGKSWSELKADEKYKQLATDDIARYKREMEAWLEWSSTAMTEGGVAAKSEENGQGGGADAKMPAAEDAGADAKMPVNDEGDETMLSAKNDKYDEAMAAATAMMNDAGGEEAMALAVNVVEEAMAPGADGFENGDVPPLEAGACDGGMAPALDVAVDVEMGDAAMAPAAHGMPPLDGQGETTAIIVGGAEAPDDAEDDMMGYEPTYV